MQLSIMKGVVFTRSRPFDGQPENCPATRIDNAIPDRLISDRLISDKKTDEQDNHGTCTIRLRLDARAEPPSAAGRTPEGRKREGLRRLCRRHQSRTAGSGRGGGLTPRRRHAGRLGAGPPRPLHAAPDRDGAVLRGQGVGFRSLTEGIDTTTAGSTLMFHIFGTLVQFQRNLKPVVTPAKIAQTRVGSSDNGLTVREAAARRGIGKTTALYAALAAIQNAAHPILQLNPNGRAPVIRVCSGLICLGDLISPATVFFRSERTSEQCSIHWLSDQKTLPRPHTMVGRGGSGVYGTHMTDIIHYVNPYVNYYVTPLPLYK